MSKAGPLIAIVDDEQSVRKALQRLLRSASIDVETFASGEEFWESLRTHRPDCVVLDLHMPRMTGFDVLTRMQEAGARVPVIIITGYDSPESRDRAMAAGASMYLCKPVNDEALLDAIAGVLSLENSYWRKGGQTTKGNPGHDGDHAS